MHGVYTLKSITSDKTAPLVRKIISTFAAFLFVFYVISLVGLAITLTQNTDFSTNRMLVIFSIFLFVFLLLALFTLILMSRIIFAPLKDLVRWAENVDALKSINLPEDTSKEIRTIYKIFNSTLERLRAIQNKLVRSERMAAIAQTTQMLAHDVRKPLSLVKMILKMMVENPTQSEKNLPLYQEEVERAILSVEGMISDVIDWGLENHNLKLETASPKALIEEALSEFKYIHRDWNVSVDTEYRNRNQVRVNKGQISRVFHNLLDNARKAMNGRGSLWLKTDETVFDGKEHVLFCIGNSDSYIPLEEQSKIFEIFYRVDNKSGSGLGLAISEKIVLAHSGKIWCRSDKTLGTEFLFTLPALHQSVNEEEKMGIRIQ